VQGKCTKQRRRATAVAIERTVIGTARICEEHVDYAQFKHEKRRTIQRVTVQSQEAFDSQQRTG